MSRRTCDELAHWLDTGDPGTPPDWVAAHVRACGRCAGALVRTRALDAWLGAALPARAPAGFDAAVMARLDGPAPRPVRPVRIPAPLWPDPMPAWVRAAMEPAVMLALLLAAVCAWQGERLGLVAVTAVRWAGGALVRASLPLPAWALAMALLPPMAVASVALYRWSGRLVMGRVFPGRGHP